MNGLRCRFPRNPMMQGRLDTLTAFNIDWRAVDAVSTVGIAEGRDLEKAPAKDGGCSPSFAGVLRL